MLSVFCNMYHQLALMPRVPSLPVFGSSEHSHPPERVVAEVNGDQAGQPELVRQAAREKANAAEKGQ